MGEEGMQALIQTTILKAIQDEKNPLSAKLKEIVKTGSTGELTNLLADKGWSKWITQQLMEDIRRDLEAKPLRPTTMPGPVIKDPAAPKR
jgi:hypothetical protein